MFKLFLIAIFTGILVSVATPLIGEGYDHGFTNPFVFLSIVLIFMQFREHEYHFHGIKARLRPDTLFLTFYYFLFLHPYFADWAGLGSIAENRFLVPPFLEFSNIAVFVSFVGLLFFILGFNGSCAKRVGVSSLSSDPRTTLREIRTSGVIGYIGFSLVAVLYIVTGAWKQLIVDYTGVGTGDATSDGLNFLLTFFSLYISAQVVSKLVLTRVITIGNLSGFIAPWAWAMICLVTGDRNNFLLIMLIPFVAYYSYFQSINFLKIALFGILAFSIYQIIEVSRQGGDRSLEGVIQTVVSGKVDVQESSSVSDSSFNLTTITSRAVYDGNLSGSPIFFGKFKLIGVMGIFPYSRGLFFDPGKEYVTSADYISDTVLGTSRTWNIGSNIISDVVLDWGVGSVPLAMLAVGFLGGYAFKIARYQLSYASVGFYVLCCALFFEYPRYTYDFLVRCIVWYLFLNFLARRICRSV